MPTADALVALAGGVGASRFLRGVVQCVDPAALTAIVNTGDDRAFYGVHVSPDLDIVGYSLAGLVDPKKGFGIAGDTFALVDRLGELGVENWFRLGDRDYANCLYRTLQLQAGRPLHAVTDELRRALGLDVRLLPMSDAPCPTYVELGPGAPGGARRLHFEEYLVRDRAPTDVAGVDLGDARAADAAPGVLEAIERASLVLVCPSNPIVSIAPILAVRGVRAALDATRAPIVAVSPIVGGAPIKGPADALMRAEGVEVSALGVASLYRDWIDGIVIDERDADQLEAIRALDLAATATDTLMVDAAASKRVADAALAVAEGLR